MANFCSKTAMDTFRNHGNISYFLNVFTGLCALLPHGAAAELSPCQRSSLKPLRRVPIGLHSLLPVLINVHTVPQIKNKHNCLCIKGSQFKSNSCQSENEQCTRSRKGLMWASWQAKCLISKKGLGWKKHQLQRRRLQTGIPWESAPVDALWSFCSRIGPARWLQGSWKLVWSPSWQQMMPSPPWDPGDVDTQPCQPDTLIHCQNTKGTWCLSDKNTKTSSRESTGPWHPWNRSGSPQTPFATGVKQVCRVIES